MKRTNHIGWPIIILAVLVIAPAAAEEKRDYPPAPMSFEQVTLQDSFWLPRLKLQAESTVPHALIQTEPLHGRGGELPFPHLL